MLSHHVDEFSLVSAFFLFSVGCVNIFLGLVFRESAKTRRSLTAWHNQYKDASDSVLPTSARAGSPTGPRPLVMYAGGWDKEREAYGYGADASRAGSLSSQKSGMGFGRQGEKAALARGFTLQRPSEALPTYIPKPVSHVRHSSHSEASTSGDETAV